MAEIKNISEYKQQIESLKKQITTEFNKIIQQIKNYENGLEENEGPDNSAAYFSSLFPQNMDSDSQEDWQADWHYCTTA